MLDGKPEILTKKEVSQFLRISLRHLDYLIQAKEIPYAKSGKRSVRFSRDTIRKWWANREKASVE